MAVYQQSPTNTPPADNRSTRFVIVLLLILLAAGIYLYYRYASSVKQLSAVEKYGAFKEFRLPKDPQTSDMDFVLDEMRFKKEFLFYFQIADRDTVKKVSGEALDIIKQNPEPESLLIKIKSLQNGVESLGAILNYVEYKKEFVDDPSTDKQLEKTINDFFYDSFLLTVVGACYKANHDAEFVFSWDANTIMATKKLQDILMEWRNLY